MMRKINFLETLIGVLVCFGAVYVICAVASAVLRIAGVA